MKKSIVLFIIIAIAVLVFTAPAVFAGTYPSVTADKSVAGINEQVNYTVVTSSSVKSLQTIIDGKTGKTYTSYTKQGNLRNWKISITFNQAGKRNVQFLAKTASGTKTYIPKQKSYITIKDLPKASTSSSNGYSVSKSASSVKSGDTVVFTVKTPVNVYALRYIIDGKTYSKITKYKTKTASQKIWEVPVKFTKAGKRSVYFSAYSSKGARLKKFPSAPIKITVREDVPKITLFQATDTQVVPTIEADPKFSVNMANEMYLTLKVYTKAGSQVASLASNLKTTGAKAFTWTVTDKNTKKAKYPTGDYVLKLNAKNNAGETKMELAFSLIPLANPEVTTTDSFVVAFDMSSLQANIKDDGNVAIADAGFYIGTTPDNLTNKISCGKVNEGSGYAKLMTGLTPGATYYFCGYAKNIGGLEAKGGVLSFATPTQSTFTAQDSLFDTTEKEAQYLFNSKTYKYTISTPPVGYYSSSEAALHMQSITIPVWKIDANGQYVSTSAAIRVHRKLAESAKAIFAEIYNLKFPVKTVYGFNYRTIKGPMACSTLSQHSYGAAIDINAAENPNVKVGAGFVDPRNPNSPYTVTTAIADIFKKYGWDWGGNWTSNKDYMHFEYLGTPVASNPVPPPAPVPSPTPAPSPEPPTDPTGE